MKPERRRKGQAKGRARRWKMNGKVPDPFWGVGS